MGHWVGRLIVKYQKKYALTKKNYELCPMNYELFRTFALALKKSVAKHVILGYRHSKKESSYIYNSIEKQWN